MSDNEFADAVADGDGDDLDDSCLLDFAPKLPHPRSVATVLKPVLERRKDILSENQQNLVYVANIRTLTPSMEDLVVNYDALYVLFRMVSWKVMALHWIGAVLLHVAALLDGRLLNVTSACSEVYRSRKYQFAWVYYLCAIKKL